MTPKEKVTAIKNLLETNLPGVLSAAGLDDFEDYLAKQPNDSNKRQSGTYIFQDDDTTDTERTGFVLHFQLPRKFDALEYHDAIYPYLQESLVPSVVDLDIREGIETDILYADNSGTSIIGYFVIFTEDLDDCQDFD